VGNNDRSRVAAAESIAHSQLASVDRCLRHSLWSCSHSLSLCAICCIFHMKCFTSDKIRHCSDFFHIAAVSRIALWYQIISWSVRLHDRLDLLRIENRPAVYRKSLGSITSIDSCRAGNRKNFLLFAHNHAAFGGVHYHNTTDVYIGLSFLGYMT